MNMVNGDLFGIRPFKAEHADDFAVRGHTIRAEVGRRTYQKDVLFLPPRERTLLEQDCSHQVNLSVNKIGPHSLGWEKVRQKSKLFPDRSKSREILVLIWLVPQIRHNFTPSIGPSLHYEINSEFLAAVNAAPPSPLISSSGNVTRLGPLKSRD